MVSNPKVMRFTKSHEWIRVEGEIAVVGITDFAQSQLSDITYVEMPELGDHFDAHEEAGVVESVKAASDIYAPVAGAITEVNRKAVETPELINSDPYEAGWLFKMKPDNIDDVYHLMDQDEYEETLPEEEE